MQRDVVFALAAKDIGSIRNNVQVWLPMLIVPLILGVVLPALLVGGVVFAGPEALTKGDPEKLEQYLAQLTAHVPQVRELPSVAHQIAYLAANYFIAPFFLIVPLMSSSVVAADSLVGEKERGTLESLLFTPVDLVSLLVGKALAAFVPAIVLTYATAALATVVVNAVGWRLFHGVFFPNLTWLPLLALVVPALALFAILLNIFISAKVSTFQAAYQLGGVLVLPIVLLAGGQASGLLLMGFGAATVLGLVLLVLDVVLLRVIAKRLDRARLFETQVR